MLRCASEASPCVRVAPPAVRARRAPPGTRKRPGPACAGARACVVPMRAVARAEALVARGSTPASVCARGPRASAGIGGGGGEPPRTHPHAAALPGPRLPPAHPVARRPSPGRAAVARRRRSSRTARRPRPPGRPAQQPVGRDGAPTWRETSGRSSLRPGLASQVGGLQEREAPAWTWDTVRVPHPKRCQGSINVPSTPTGAGVRAVAGGHAPSQPPPDVEDRRPAPSQSDHGRPGRDDPRGFARWPSTCC